MTKPTEEALRLISTEIETRLAAAYEKRITDVLADNSRFQQEARDERARATNARVALEVVTANAAALARASTSARLRELLHEEPGGRTFTLAGIPCAPIKLHDQAQHVIANVDACVTKDRPPPPVPTSWETATRSLVASLGLLGSGSVDTVIARLRNEIDEGRRGRRGRLVQDNRNTYELALREIVKTTTGNGDGTVMELCQRLRDKLDPELEGVRRRFLGKIPRYSLESQSPRLRGKPARKVLAVERSDGRRIIVRYENNGYDYADGLTLDDEQPAAVAPVKPPPPAPVKAGDVVRLADIPTGAVYTYAVGEAKNAKKRKRTLEGGVDEAGDFMHYTAHSTGAHYRIESLPYTVKAGDVVPFADIPIGAAYRPADGSGGPFLLVREADGGRVERFGAGWLPAAKHVPGPVYLVVRLPA